MFIKPNRPTPDAERGGYLADEGRTVEPTPYWMRRIADGDVSEAEGPLPDQPEPATTVPPQSPPTAGSSVSATRKPSNART